MQVILDSSFARPGSAPIWGGKKVEFRDWTTRFTALRISFKSALHKSSTFVRHIGFHGGLGMNIVGPRYQALSQFPLFSNQASPWDLPPGIKSLQALLS